MPKTNSNGPNKLIEILKALRIEVDYGFMPGYTIYKIMRGDYEELDKAFRRFRKHD